MAKRTKPSAKFQARAKAFADAVDVGLKSFAAQQEKERQEMVAFAEELKASALNPAPGFSTLKSLAYLEDAFFTEWNEGVGEHIEQFWNEISRRKLPFGRKDIIGDVLRRGRIRNDIEYEHVTDAMVIFRQLGKISAEDEDRLSQMLGDYERRASRRLG